MLHRVGLSFESLVVEGSSLAHWGEAEVHRLVATFLQVSEGGGRGGPLHLQRGMDGASFIKGNGCAKRAECGFWGERKGSFFPSSSQPLHLSPSLPL